MVKLEIAFATKNVVLSIFHSLLCLVSSLQVWALPRPLTHSTVTNADWLWIRCVRTPHPHCLPMLCLVLFPTVPLFPCPHPKTRPSLRTCPLTFPSPCCPSPLCPASKQPPSSRATATIPFSEGQKLLDKSSKPRLLITCSVGAEVKHAGIMHWNWIQCEKKTEIWI